MRQMLEVVRSCRAWKSRCGLKHIGEEEESSDLIILDR